eukprot:TRINITY_DN15594_c0_g1_i1.p1 TRINITY_DN15594_c0_g1~~TRINITY_DN15594_c0_g1_i1.p1  ORF type:complete len:656 (-),score=129.94 TRINITY_DN15594_c0_g1_i1:29-1963(-)
MSLLRAIVSKWAPKDWADHTWQSSLEGTWSSKDVDTTRTEGQGIQVLWSGGLTAQSLGLKTEGPTGVSNPEDAVHEFSDIYEEGDEIGRGSFGIVRVGRHKSSGTQCVVKSVPREKVGDAYFENHAKGSWRFLKFSRQTETHRNIIRYLDFLMAPAMMYSVMEELRGPELFTYLQEHAPITETFCHHAMRQLLSALEHLHSLGIIHRDVKVEALRFRDLSPHADLVLFDFGHCVSAEEKEREVIGTVSYMAPEAFGHDYSSQVDLWSAGVVLYIMLCGCLPFRRDPTRRPSPPRPEALSIALARKELLHAPAGSVKLLQGLLVMDPSARFSAATALQASWMQAVQEGAACLEVVREAYQAAQQECVQSSCIEPFPEQSLDVTAELVRNQAPYLAPSTEALREEFAAASVHAEGLRPCSTEALREELELKPYAAQAAGTPQMNFGMPGPGMFMMPPLPYLPQVPAGEPLSPPSCSSSAAASPCNSSGAGTGGPTQGFQVQFTFTVLKSKLLSREQTVVSSMFEIPMGDEQVNFRVLVSAKHLNNRRNGHCFKTAKGKASLQLKCEGTPPAHAPCLAFSFRVGNGDKAELRGPAIHDFSETLVGRLAPGVEEWDLMAAMDSSTGTCTIQLEITPTSEVTTRSARCS